MNVTRALVVGLSLSMWSACGAQQGAPCSGDTCLDIAGTYVLNVQSPADGNSCKNIHYLAGDEFTMNITLTQSGSEVEYHVAAGLEYTMAGTLYDNSTAVFKRHIDHIVVHGSTHDWDYANDADALFSFVATEEGMLISGSHTDGLTANGDPVPGDESCFLTMSINGQR